MTTPPAIPSIAPRDAAAATTPPATAGDTASGPLIVDVREPDEFASERIEGAALVPISQFAIRHGELPKDRPLHVICHSGGRSSSATMYLLQNGWTDVRNISGGMTAWMQAGLPVRRGTPEPGEGDL